MPLKRAPHIRPVSFDELMDTINKTFGTKTNDMNSQMINIYTELTRRSSEKDPHSQ
jgi:DNA-directed RNA polymerase delta subunit